MDLLKRVAKTDAFMVCCLHFVYIVLIGFKSYLVQKTSLLADCCSLSLAEGDLASLHPCNSVECA